MPRLIHNSPEAPTDARDELQPWALRAFERAYQRDAERRPRCSRGDFYAGYRAALMELHAYSQFKLRPLILRLPPSESPSS